MSLFSNTNQQNLTPIPVKAVQYRHVAASAPFRLLSLGVVLGFLLVMVAVSIFFVQLRPVPPLPGTQTGETRNTPRFVQALDTLHKSSSLTIMTDKLPIGRGDLHEVISKEKIPGKRL
jgi:hypothetical protein